MTLETLIHPEDARTLKALKNIPALVIRKITDYPAVCARNRINSPLVGAVLKETVNTVRKRPHFNVNRSFLLQSLHLSYNKKFDIQHYIRIDYNCQYPKGNKTVLLYSIIMKYEL